MAGGKEEEKEEEKEFAQEETDQLLVDEVTV